jgi:hypothetical protein
MKKTIIAIMVITATAVACNKAEVIESNPGQAIAFGEAFVDNATKATDNTYSGTSDLTSFNVYGTVTGTAGTVNIFDGVAVTGTVGAAEWSYAEQYAQYWIPGADYAFAAVVDADAVTQNALKMPTSLTYNTEGQKDLLYATAAVEDAVATQGVVNFTFSHLLSKAQFTVTSNTAGGYYHTVTGIKVSNFETGTYTIANGSWAGTTAKEIEFGEVAEVTTASGPKTNATQMLLVPNTATFNVTFTVDLYKNGTKLGTETQAIPVENDLLKGNAYNFTIECSVGNPIKFTVTNDPTWSEQSEVTIQ